jgi:hypothetical protein
MQSLAAIARGVATFDVAGTIGEAATRPTEASST